MAPILSAPIFNGVRYSLYEVFNVRLVRVSSLVFFHWAQSPTPLASTFVALVLHVVSCSLYVVRLACLPLKLSTSPRLRQALRFEAVGTVKPCSPYHRTMLR